MTYYNTLVKIYGLHPHTSLRFIRYNTTKSVCDTDEELKKYSAYKKGRYIYDAEVEECREKKEERDYKQEAIARSKRNIKEIIRNNYSSHFKLLTLTYSYLVTDKQKVFNDIKNMSKRFKDHYGETLRYIATLEWQKKRHCLHVHMIVDCDFISSEMWEKRLWQQGFIKINSIYTGNKKNNINGAIDYVLKYVTKDCESATYHKHLYFRSHNWGLYIEKSYQATNNIYDCIHLARRFFQSESIELSKYDYKISDDIFLEIIDIYPIFETSQ